MTKFFKKSKKPCFGAILDFYPNVGKNKFSWKKWLSVFKYSNYLPSPKIRKNERAIPEENAELMDRWADMEERTDYCGFVGPSVEQGSNYQNNFKFSWIYIKTPKSSLFY